jgi:nitrite reductase/ring-hydroxylating ferredoxin subunit
MVMMIVVTKMIVGKAEVAVLASCTHGHAGRTVRTVVYHPIVCPLHI